jgi:hypothetical protein
MRARWKRAGHIRWGGSFFTVIPGRPKDEPGISRLWREIPGSMLAHRPGMTIEYQSAYSTRPRVSGSAKAAMKNTA